MKGFISTLQSMTIVINTSKKCITISHFKFYLFLIAFSGLSTIICYLLISIFGNSLMLPVAFIGPAITMYIYTLAVDLVNPALLKLADSVSATEDAISVDRTALDQSAEK